MLVKTGKTMQEVMEGHFFNIRAAYGKMKEAVSGHISKAYDSDSKDSKLYKDDVLQEIRVERNNETLNRINACKAKALRKIDDEFASIRVDLKDWILQEPSDRFTSVLNAFMKYDITPSKAEIEILKDLSAGNYVAMKIISAIGAKSGLNIEHTSVEGLQEMLRQAQARCHDYTNAYAGGMADNSYLSDDIGLNISPSLSFFRNASELFMEKGREHDIFNEIEEALCSVTDAHIDLAPSKREELNKIFGDTSGDARVQIAVRLIEEHNSLANLLPVYDAELNEQAVRAILDAKTQYAELKKAEAQQAFSVAAEAMHAAGDNSLYH